MQSRALQPRTAAVLASLVLILPALGGCSVFNVANDAVTVASSVVNVGAAAVNVGATAVNVAAGAVNVGVSAVRVGANAAGTVSDLTRAGARAVSGATDPQR